MHTGFLHRYFRYCSLTLLFACCFFLPQFVNAQKNELDVKSLDFNEFPKVKAEIWTRNADGIDTSQFRILEGNKFVKLKYTGKKDSVLVKKNKSILFLVLNPGNSERGYLELEWYKKVITDAINSSTIKPGDKIDILDFNHQFSGQILFPSTINFTDDLDVLYQRVNSLTTRANSPQSCSNRGSLVLPAIDRALDLIQGENLTIPSGIVVLSDDVVCPSNQVEDLANKAKRRNIPIYSIVFSAYRQPFNSIDSFCTKTYGGYYKDINAGFNTERSSAELNEYLNSFLTRHKGLIYKYEWNSDLSKDGEEHLLTLKYRDLSTEHKFVTPSKNFIEWCSANPLLACGLLLMIGLLIGGAIFYNNNQKKKKAKEEEKFLDLKRKQESEAGQLSSLLQQQKSEIEQMKERERVEKAEQEEIRKREAKAENDKELIRQMKMRGGFPNFDCIAGGRNFMFTINRPEVYIGRNNDCDLSLNFPTVSKKHCKVTFIGNGYLLEDLGSSNGTIVNSKQTQKVILKHGDVVRLGEVILNFRF
jgi:hypothetical protein